MRAFKNFLRVSTLIWLVAGCAQEPPNMIASGSGALSVPDSANDGSPFTPGAQKEASDSVPEDHTNDPKSADEPAAVDEQNANGSDADPVKDPEILAPEVCAKEGGGEEEAAEDPSDPSGKVRSALLMVQNRGLLSDVTNSAYAITRVIGTLKGKVERVRIMVLYRPGFGWVLANRCHRGQCPDEIAVSPNDPDVLPKVTAFLSKNRTGLWPLLPQHWASVNLDNLDAVLERLRKKQRNAPIVYWIKLVPNFHVTILRR